MTQEKKITAKLHPSGFNMSDANYYSLNILEDQNIYYTLCSHNIDTYGRIYRYHAGMDKVELFADLGEVTGEAGKKILPHGKSHTPIMESDGKIYVATNYGFYQGNNGKGKHAPPPRGYSQYLGGKIIEYDKASGQFSVLASAPPEEGIITMNMDPVRKKIYCITWPKGIFMYYDLEKKKLKIIGPVSRGGEIGVGDNYFCICRILAVDPRDGVVYFTNSDGEILRFHTDTDTVQPVRWAHMRKEVFGEWDPHKVGHQGYNWRQILWNPKYGCFFGVHGKTGYLFSFDPGKNEMEVIDRICCERCKRSGLYEYFRYGYMTLGLDPDDQDTLYYISGYYNFKDPDDERNTIAWQQGRFVFKDDYDEIISYLTLVTYHLPSGKYMDHGTIQLEDGRYPSLAQSIAVHPNGRIYTCPWIPKPREKFGKGVEKQCDLISFANPIKGKNQV